MSVEVTIVCDCCGKVAAAHHRSAAAARAELRAMGGRVNLRGGKDICSWCASQRSGVSHEHTERMLQAPS